MAREDIRQERLFLDSGVFFHRQNIRRWRLRKTTSICCIAQVWKRIIVMILASCRCRASCFVSRGRHFRTTSFVSATNAGGANTALLSRYARLQPDNEEQPDSWQIPPRKPPPKARPMPPTLESFESSNTFYDVEESSTSDAFEAPDYYDPQQLHEDALSLYNEFANQDSSRSLDLHAPKAETTTPVPPPITYNYEEQNDFPNPHNYWDDKPTLSVEKEMTAKEKETSVRENETSMVSSSNPVKDVPTQTVEEKETSRAAPINRVTDKKLSNISSEKTPPKTRMPPRATFASQPPSNREEVYRMASSGDAMTSDAEMLTKQLERLETDIYAQNNKQEFNIQSVKQVSQVLFGEPGHPTNKETLEAMAGAGHVMANLILQYRSLRRRIARLEKKEENRSNGTLVNNISQQTSSNMSDEQVVEGDPLLLVDASAYIWRAYFSMPPLHRADGMPVGAVLGFCNMLNRLVLSRMMQGECPRLVLIFDAKGKNFRNALYDDYKANRPECPMDLIPQFDLIREAAEAYGIHQLEAPNFEADDVIATLATMALKEGVSCNILSGDKDLMQLITPEEEIPSIQMLDPMTMSRVSHDVVVSKWNVTPDQLGDVLALAGDSADNIPGVPGIGPKIAASLIGEYGTLDELFERVETVKQKGRRAKLIENMDKARLSRQLVNLERDIPMDKMTFPGNLTSAAELRMAPLDGDQLLSFYDSMGLKDLKRRVQARLNQRKTASDGASKGKRYYSKRPRAQIPTPDDFKDVPF